MIANQRHVLEVHTEVARQERQRQEETRNKRQLSHAFILAGCDSVEDQ